MQYVPKNVRYRVHATVLDQAIPADLYPPGHQGRWARQLKTIPEFRMRDSSAEPHDSRTWSKLRNKCLGKRLRDATKYEGLDTTHYKIYLLAGCDCHFTVMDSADMRVSVPSSALPLCGYTYQKFRSRQP